MEFQSTQPRTTWISIFFVQIRKINTKLSTLCPAKKIHSAIQTISKKQKERSKKNEYARKNDTKLSEEISNKYILEWT